jgi:chemotaxis protein MotB
MSKAVVAFALLAAAGAGAYGYIAHSRYTNDEDLLARERADRTHTTEDLATCQRARDTERSDADRNMKATQGELDALRAERAESEKRLEAFRALTEKFRKMIDSGKLKVEIRHGRMVVKLPSEILFAPDSADVSKEGVTALGEVAKVLAQIHDRRFMVAGHTDNQRIKPPSQFKSNLELSIARGENVAEALIAAGMPGSRLSVAGYGEYEPVRENGSEAGRKENRRIEIVLLPNLAELPDVPAALAAPSASPPSGPAPSASAPSSPVPSASAAPSAN